MGECSRLPGGARCSPRSSGHAAQAPVRFVCSPQQPRWPQLCSALRRTLAPARSGSRPPTGRARSCPPSPGWGRRRRPRPQRSPRTRSRRSARTRRRGGPRGGQVGDGRLQQAVAGRARQDVHRSRRLHRREAQSSRREVVRPRRALGQLGRRRRAHSLERARRGGRPRRCERWSFPLAAVGGPLSGPGERGGALQGAQPLSGGRWRNRAGGHSVGLWWRPVVHRGERLRDVGGRVPRQPAGSLEGDHHHASVPQQAQPSAGARIRRRLRRCDG